MTISRTNQEKLWYESRVGVKVWGQVQGHFKVKSRKSRKSRNEDIFYMLLRLRNVNSRLVQF